MIFHDFSPQAHQVIYTTLAEVAYRYGDGKKAGFIASYPYHNLSHALSVMEGSIELTRHLNLSQAAIELAAMSGAAHDVIRERIGDTTPEQASAAWLHDVMKSYDYGDDDISVTTEAILATTASVDEHGMLIAQTHAIDSDSETGKVALSVASADLWSLYKPDGMRIAHNYFRELKGLSGSEVPISLDGLREFEASEVALLRDYCFPLAAAEKLSSTYREDAVAQHAYLLTLLEEGRLADWQEIERFDTTYYRRHAS